MKTLLISSSVPYNLMWVICKWEQKQLVAGFPLNYLKVFQRVQKKKENTEKLKTENNYDFHES